MFKKIKLSVLEFLGIASFTKGEDGKEYLTEEQKAQLEARVSKPFTDMVVAGLESEGAGNAPDDTVGNAMYTELQASFQAVLARESDLKKMLDDEKKSKENEKTAREAAEGIITQQKKTIETLSKKPEHDPDPKVIDMNNKKAWVPSGKDTHLFGVDLPFLAIDDKHAYNKRAYAAMAARHGIEISAPQASSSLDYSSLSNDLGEYYRIRKQDRIQSFLRALPSLEKMFPLESGCQDRAVLVNLFLTSDFSQADSTALGSTFENVVKGSYKFEPEVLTMFPVMFVHQFKQLKQLEKSWIGYLNREGSDTMKWSFIEYILVETGTKLKNEQEIRRIRGVFKAPAENVAGTANQAANGLLKFLKNQIALFKVQPFTLGEWTPSTIAAHIKNGTKLIPEVLRDSGQMILYMSTDALSDYHANLEVLYGQNQDYKSGIDYVKEYPSVKIKTISGMAPSKRLIWTLDKNIALFEDKAGEMLNFNLEQQDWRLKVWSNWKESIWMYLVGRKYASAAEMPGDYSTQMVFCNDVDEPADYFIPMDAGDTIPSVLNHSSLISVANAAATAITDIDDCAIGQQVILKCGNATNAITIAQAGKFSLLTAAWNPTVGDKLYLKKRSPDGKFIELKREAVSSDAIAIAADDATPDVSGGSKFITVANTVDTAITNLDNAVVDKVYTIYGGSNTKASTIANAGNFSLTAAMTLNAGTFIQLQKAENGTIYEIARG